MFNGGTFLAAKYEGLPYVGMIENKMEHDDKVLLVRYWPFLKNDNKFIVRRNDPTTDILETEQQNFLFPLKEAHAINNSWTVPYQQK